MSLAKELQERGFIHQFSSESLEEILDGEKRTIYHGIDPTADSAHAGNFVNWMLLRHLAKHGHKIIFLVGGGTGMIGDPKPDTERQLKTLEQVEENVQKIKAQAERLFSGLEVEFVNNYEWLGELQLVDFLRDIGKHYTVNELIKKDAIATRLQSDTGLSYTEFAYPLLQGYDYYQLYETRGCTVQVGGSDQWGNIISGVELVRRKSKAEVYAVTVPLIVDKTTGMKFGKSEGNAVWLDAEKTSPYEFYQFWLNVSDDNVIDYLKLFTFLSQKEITEAEKTHQTNPGARQAQLLLAKMVTEIVHGQDAATAAENVSKILFSDTSYSEISEQEKAILLTTAPVTPLTEETALVEVLVMTSLATSKREARTFIESGAVSINGEKITTTDYVCTKEIFISDLAVVKRGKKNVHILTC